MVFLDIQLNGFTVTLPAEYPDTGSHFLRQLTLQYSEAILRNPDNVILAVLYSMC